MSIAAIYMKNMFIAFPACLLHVLCNSSTFDPPCNFHPVPGFSLLTGVVEIELDESLARIYSGAEYLTYQSVQMSRAEYAG